MVKFECDNFALQQIAESGQCFRWFEKSKSIPRYNIVADGKVLDIMQNNNCFYLSCAQGEYDTFWHSYFDLNTNYEQFGQTIDSNDAFLSSAYQHGSGIRILRQPLWETIVSFIISQRKSIPAIKTSIERLCKAYGDKIKGTEYYAFPEPKQLLNMTRDDCGLGYRLPYINELAKKVVNGEFDLEQLYELDHESAKKQLLSVCGIGEKVANCILLFGLGHIEACPIDVWVQRIVDEEYNGIVPKWMKSECAGILQQWTFFYKRMKNKKDRRRFNSTKLIGR